MGILQARNTFANLFGQGIRFPSEHEAHWVTASVKYSPDLGWLEQSEFQLLFCADDTKLGHEYHCMIEESALAATGYTAAHFNYYYLNVGDEDRLPIPMQTNQLKHHVRYFPPPLKIQGELHAVRSWQFKDLDTYKRNTVQFRRKRMNIIVPYREVITEEYFDEDGRELPLCLQGKKGILSPERVYIIRAWMYVAMNEYWDNILDGGFRGFKTVNHYESRRPWLREYYAYPKSNFKSS